MQGAQCLRGVDERTVSTRTNMTTAMFRTVCLFYITCAGVLCVISRDAESDSNLWSRELSSTLDLILWYLGFEHC